MTKLISLADKPEELKPCPFCGGKAETIEPYENIFSVECTKCLAESFYASIAVYKDPRVAAIKAWNKRSYESELAKLRDLLDRAKGMIKPTLKLMACEEIEQWLKDLSEVCGE